MPLLVGACPGFADIWKASIAEYGEELVYVVLGDFARYLLHCKKGGQLDELARAGEVIERLHVDGDADVREIATIGILEAIQNVWGNYEADPESFRTFLKPESARWWQSLNDFWEGKVRYVGDGL